MNSTLLECRDLSVYNDEGGVLEDISFVLNAGANLALTGETGSGKSTLMRCVAGLHQPGKGEVLFRGVVVDGPEQKLVPGHPQIAYLSQLFELPRFLRVEQVLGYADTLAHGRSGKIYELCQIDHLLKRKTDQLSGGERQRIALARLLIGAPSLLLLDEPFSHLDPDHKRTLKQVIDDITRSLEITCAMVSHDPEDTLPWADKILVLRRGRVVQYAPPEEIYNHPGNEYVAGLFGDFSMVKWNGKDFLLRPEEISVCGEESARMTGSVENVRYHGNRYVIRVAANNAFLTVSTRESLQKGDLIGLTWPDHRVWNPIR